MARIKGVDIPNNKRIEIALTYIYGIGRSLSKRILKDAKVDANKRAGQLDNDELNRIREQLDKYTIEGDLRLNYKWKLIHIVELVIKKDYLLEVKEQTEMLELVRVKVKL